MVANGWRSDRHVRPEDQQAAEMLTDHVVAGTFRAFQFFELAREPSVE